MFIFFQGKTAQEHPLHRLDPGVNEVPDSVGRELRRIAKGGSLPIRDATPAEEREFVKARTEREAKLRAEADKAQAAAAAAARTSSEGDEFGPEDPTPTPAPRPAADGKPKP